MLTINLTENQVLALGSLLKAASKDDATPVIANVKITMSESRVQAVATDRYKVVEIGFDLGSEAKGLVGPKHSFLVSAKDLAEIAKRVRALKTYAMGEIVRFDVADFKLIVTYLPEDKVLGEFLLGQGSYPPVERLFTKFEDDIPSDLPVALNPVFIADIASVFPPQSFRDSAADRKLSSLKFTLSKTEGVGNVMRPATVLVERPGTPGEDFRALLMPNLMLSK